MNVSALPIGDRVRIMWRQQFSAPPEPEDPFYIVGDLHGRFDLLFRMITLIENDAEDLGLTKPKIVFVGDYVDRGPQSDRVLALLVTLKSDPAWDITTLKGNHEEMLLNFLAAPTDTRSWLAHGGFETLMSYGLTSVTENSPNDLLMAGARELSDLMGDEVIEFLNALELSYTSGNIFVSHAGADPARPVNDQKEKSLVWGSSKFRSRPRRDGIWVAHGHFAETEASADFGRISVDTGAYYSNTLTAARLANGEISFLSVEV